MGGAGVPLVIMDNSVQRREKEKKKNKKKGKDSRLNPDWDAHWLDWICKQLPLSGSALPTA